MSTKKEVPDIKPGPRSKRLSVVAGELTKEAAVEASPGPLTPRRSARLSGSFPSPALDSLVLPTRRRRSSSSSSMTEETKAVKPRLKATEVPEKIEEEEVVIIDDPTLMEESTPRKRTRLGRRQSELLEKDSAVESSCKTSETRSKKVSDIDEVMIVNEDLEPKEQLSLQTRTRRGRRLSELMENCKPVESPSKARATRSRKFSDIDEVLIIDEDPVQEDAISPPKQTRPCDVVVIEDETIVAIENAVVTIDEKDTKVTPKSLNEIAVTSAGTETLRRESSSVEEKEVYSEVFAEDFVTVKTVLKKASMGEELEEKADDDNHNEKAAESYQEEKAVEADQEEAAVKVVKAVQEEEAVKADQEEEALKGGQDEGVKADQEEAVEAEQEEEAVKADQEEAVKANQEEAVKADQEEADQEEAVKADQEEEAVKADQEEAVETEEKTVKADQGEAVADQGEAVEAEQEEEAVKADQVEAVEADQEEEAVKADQEEAVKADQEEAVETDQEQVAIEIDQEEEAVETDQEQEAVETDQEEMAVEAVVKVDQKEDINEISESDGFAKEIIETALDQFSKAAEAVESPEVSQTEEGVQLDVSALTKIDQSSIKVDSLQGQSSEDESVQDEDEEMVEIIEKTLLEKESKNQEEFCKSPKTPSAELKGKVDNQTENDVEMGPQEIGLKTDTNARQVQMPKINPKLEGFVSTIVKSVNQETECGSDEKENANVGHKNCEPGPSRLDNANPGPSKGGAMKKSHDLSLGRRVSGRFWKSDRDRFRSVIKSRGLKTSFKQRKEQKDTLKRVKEMEQILKDETNRQKEELKARQEANKKKREENEKRTEIVQEIKNPAKLKRMKKKQVRLLEKRDTTVVQKHP